MSTAYFIREIESARSPGWYEIDCNWCDDWYTAGWETVCEDAWYEHAQNVHPRRFEGVWHR